jgi:Concanavalin A-like lectin/glucanases superfamily
MRRLILVPVLSVFIGASLLPSCVKAPPIKPDPKGEDSVCTCPKDSLDPDMVAYYTFTGNTKDSTKNHNDGVGTDLVLTTDKFGNANKAYLFNGTSSHVKIPFSTSLDLKESFTLSAWIQPEIIKNDFQSIFWHGDSQNGHDPYHLFLQNNTAGVRKDVLDGSIFNTLTFPFQNNLLGRWSNIVGSFDAPTKTIKLYIDGSLVATQVFSSSVINYAPLTNFYSTIGSVEESFGFFKGKIDEVRVYKRALSEEDAKKLSITYY